MGVNKYYNDNIQIISDEVNTVCKSLDTIYMYLARTKGVPDDILADADSIDFVRIVSLRTKLEKLIKENDIEKIKSMEEPNEEH